jgi:Fanconi anemia group M protein
VLIATSVAEEGLDIPSTDLVLFYEPVPSEIRSIQRRGRTGRNTVGRVVVLMSRGTRDEGAYRVSQSKEKRMYKTMQNMKDGQAMTNMLNNGTPAQQPLPEQTEGTHAETDSAGGAMTGGSDAAGPEPVTAAQPAEAGQTSPGTFGKKENDGQIEIYVDSREMRSAVVKALESKGVKMDFHALPVGDYVLSDRVCVERKTTDDFLNTLFDPARGLFDQIINMKREYLRPVMIVEGEGLYTKRRISPEAIHGIIASIMVDYGIPVLFTANEEDTASYIYTLARREQLDRKRTVNPHARKTSQTLSERQEYLVSAISEVGPVIARNLLSHFGSVKNIAEASVEELQAVDKVGPKTAARIREIMDSQYQTRD